MNTITSNKSLVFWKQNINGSNITTVKPLFLKENYLSVFEQIKIRTDINDSKTKFLNIWHYIINNECKIIDNKLKHYTTDNESINLVINKFRGNIGEIFVEKLFIDFGMNFDVVPSSYVPVDPTHEEYIDAEGIHPADGFPVGIQIKNYSKDFKENQVNRLIFSKSMAMTTHWLQDNKKVDPDNFIKFLKIPRQIIFSFTDVKDHRVLTDYQGSVRFIGPKTIEKLDLTNKSYIFEQIISEISSL